MVEVRLRCPASRLFETTIAQRVIVVDLPKRRAFMHLDTAMIMVDRDAFCVYPYLPDTLRSFTLTPVGRTGHYDVHENRDLFETIAAALEIDNRRVLKVPISRAAAVREQWDDANIFLALEPGVEGVVLRMGPGRLNGRVEGPKDLDVSGRRRSVTRRGTERGDLRLFR